MPETELKFDPNTPMDPDTWFRAHNDPVFEALELGLHQWLLTYPEPEYNSRLPHDPDVWLRDPTDPDTYLTQDETRLWLLLCTQPITHTREIADHWQRCKEHASDPASIWITIARIREKLVDDAIIHTHAPNKNGYANRRVLITSGFFRQGKYKNKTYPIPAATIVVSPMEI